MAVETPVDSATPEKKPDILDTPAAGPTAIRGAAVRLVGYGISVLLGVAAMALLFRHLGVEDGGRYVTIVALVATLRRHHRRRLGDNRCSRAHRALRCGSRLLLSQCARAPRCDGARRGSARYAFAAAAGYGPTLLFGTVLAGIGFVLQSVQLTLAAPLVTGLRQGWVAALDVARWLAFALLIAALVGLGASILPFLAATIPAGIIALGLTARLVRRDVPLRPSFSPAPGKVWGRRRFRSRLRSLSPPPISGLRSSSSHCS